MTPPSLEIRLSDYSEAQELPVDLGSKAGSISTYIQERVKKRKQTTNYGDRWA